MASVRTLGLFVTVAALSVSTGCGDDDDVPSFDMGAPQDMQIVIDGVFVPADGGLMDQGGPRPDSGPSACLGACRPDEPTSCDEADRTCVLWRSGPMCVAEVGTVEPGSPCEATDQCTAGHACFQRRTGGVCGKICCPSDPTTCADDEECRGTGILVDGTGTAYGECQPPRSCDVLAADACEPGEACYITGLEETTCLATGTAEAGEECIAANDCAAGFTCVGTFESTCARVCRLGTDDACPDGEGVCQAYAQSPEGTGLCTPDTTVTP